MNRLGHNYDFYIDTLERLIKGVNARKRPELTCDVEDIKLIASQRASKRITVLNEPAPNPYLILFQGSYVVWYPPPFDFHSNPNSIPLVF